MLLKAVQGGQGHHAAILLSNAVCRHLRHCHQPWQPPLHRTQEKKTGASSLPMRHRSVVLMWRTWWIYAKGLRWRSWVSQRRSIHPVTLFTLSILHSAHTVKQAALKHSHSPWYFDHLCAFLSSLLDTIAGQVHTNHLWVGHLKWVRIQSKEEMTPKHKGLVLLLNSYEIILCVSKLIWMPERIKWSV